ncbi:MAG: DUF4335 domain-containing protein [Mastigocoleus sp.]
MPLSNTVLRRYTPPTCTLEVWAENSPLSRWTKKSVLKQLSFELRFDDPRLGEAQKMKIQGDHNQLEALCTTVSNYVQELLQKTPENFWKGHFPPQDTIQDDRQEHSQKVGDSNVTNHAFNTGFPQKPVAGIFLQPTTQLNHQLFLGSLANATSGSSIYLSQLQLFDLASALEEYSAEAISLPPVIDNKGTFPILTWIPAAAVVVAALGLAPLTWQYANRIRQQDSVASKTSSAPETVASQPNISQDLEISPSPIPTNASSGILGTQPLVSPTALPNTSLNSFSTPPAIPAPNTVSASPKTTFPNAGNSSKQQSSSQIITSAKPPLSSEDILKSPGGSIGNSPSSPNLQKNSESPAITIQSNNKNNSGSNFSAGGLKTKPGSLPVIPNSSTLDTQPPKLPDISTNSGITPSSIATDSKTSALIREIRRQNSSANTPKAASSPKVATGDSTLFDTNQVAQVRQYLKKRWRPPAGLKQTLEYSLTVGVDGTIEQILPLGGAAREYFSSTGMPPIGETFVSPSKNGQNTRIRAVFSPSGKVQAFPETD